MKKKDVTIGVINYNGLTKLPKTISALQKLEYPVSKIIVVDDYSTDGSKDWLQTLCPQFQCIHLNKNIGPAGARNVILEKATTDYVFIIDNDISVEPDTLTYLMKAMRIAPNVGICHAELRDENDPMVYHYNGGWIHYLGTFISRPKREYFQSLPTYEQFDVVGGAALLINKHASHQIGNFDADFINTWGDGDFTARLTLAGYRCLNIPLAVAHHRSESPGTAKVFYQVRNRWYFILKLYHWRTLCLITPMLCLFEVLQAALLIKKGALFDYCRGNLAVLKDLPTILSKRRAFQTQKKLSDRDWLHAGQMYIPTTIVKSSSALDRLQQAFYGLCRVYWRIVRPLCG